ncbi:MAG: ATP-binding protein [Spirochaetales bacterium]|nr:ATP-binding protein [Spirochaetales bacterium]
MYNVKQENDSFMFESSSRLCYVDTGVEDCKIYLKNSGFDEFSDFILVMRELLINAIEHGNGNVIERKVTCTITRMDRGRFTLTVTDEGEGFEYKRLNLTLPKSGNKGRRCGYPLIYALADKIQFNEKGNHVTAYVTIPSKIKFHIDVDAIKVIITPSGDLTATSAEEFRSLLMKLYDKGHEVFYFNMKEVNDMDSISLGVFFSFGKMLYDKKEHDEINMTKPVLAHVDRRLLDFFILTGLDQLYTISVNGKEA